MLLLGLGWERVVVKAVAVSGVMVVKVVLKSLAGECHHLVKTCWWDGGRGGGRKGTGWRNGNKLGRRLVMVVRISVEKQL